MAQMAWMPHDGQVKIRILLEEIDDCKSIQAWHQDYPPSTHFLGELLQVNNVVPEPSYIDKVKSTACLHEASALDIDLLDSRPSSLNALPKRIGILIDQPVIFLDNIHTDARRDVPELNHGSSTITPAT